MATTSMKVARALRLAQELQLSYEAEAGLAKAEQEVEAAEKQTHTLYLGTIQDLMHKKIVVSEEDNQKIENLNRRRLEEATITDLETGKKLVVRWGDCGADCMCALELVRIGKKTKRTVENDTAFANIA